MFSFPTLVDVTCASARFFLSSPPLYLIIPSSLFFLVLLSLTPPQQYEEALVEAEKCLELAKEWPRGYYRKVYFFSFFFFFFFSSIFLPLFSPNLPSPFLFSLSFFLFFSFLRPLLSFVLVVLTSVKSL